MRMAHIWEKSYPQGVSWDALLPPPVPLESLLETAASKWPDRIALDFYDRTFTFRELHGLAARAAKGLQALGVGPGVHVGLHLPNTPHFVIGFFAVLMAGGRVVNFSPLAAPRELQYQLADSEAQVMITLGLPMLYPQIAALKGTGKFQTLVVCSIEDFLPAPVARAFGPAADRVAGAGRELDFAALLANDGAFTRHPHGPLEDEVAVLQYTGGTTGQPKGVLVRHSWLYPVACANGFVLIGEPVPDSLDALRATTQRLSARGDGDAMVCLPAPPLMHATGMYTTLGALLGRLPDVTLLRPGRARAHRGPAARGHGLDRRRRVRPAAGRRAGPGGPGRPAV
jgi:long-chain acyl-CoA synthetase